MAAPGEAMKARAYLGGVLFTLGRKLCDWGARLMAQAAIDALRKSDLSAMVEAARADSEPLMQAWQGAVTRKWCTCERCKARRAEAAKGMN